MIRIEQKGYEQVKHAPKLSPLFDGYKDNSLKFF